MVGFRNGRLYFSSVKPTGREAHDNRPTLRLVEVVEGKWPLSVWPCAYAATGCFSLSPKIAARDFVTIKRYVGRSVDFASLVSPMYSERLPELD